MWPGGDAWGSPPDITLIHPQRELERWSIGDSGAARKGEEPVRCDLMTDAKTNISVARTVFFPKDAGLPD